MSQSSMYKSNRHEEEADATQIMWGKKKEELNHSTGFQKASKDHRKARWQKEENQKDQEIKLSPRRERTAYHIISYNTGFPANRLNTTWRLLALAMSK